MSISRAASDHLRAATSIGRRSAAAYALLRIAWAAYPTWLRGMVQQLWPWNEPIRMEAPPHACLVRAGALIVAEIAQLDRKRWACALAARSCTCRPRITSTIIHVAPSASATEDAQHPFAARAHGLTDTLDRVVAADERDFRGDIAPGGSL
jgi:hypothetical protein